MAAANTAANAATVGTLNQLSAFFAHSNYAGNADQTKQILDTVMGHKTPSVAMAGLLAALDSFGVKL